MVFLGLRQKVGVLPELRWGTQGASRVASGKTYLLSSCKGKRRIALQSLQGKRASSRIEELISWCFSNCGGKM